LPVDAHRSDASAAICVSPGRPPAWQRENHCRFWQGGVQVGVDERRPPEDGACDVSVIKIDAVRVIAASDRCARGPALECLHLVGLLTRRLVARVVAMTCAAPPHAVRNTEFRAVRHQLSAFRAMRMALYNSA
jgi:hypothetical protein